MSNVRTKDMLLRIIANLLVDSMWPKIFKMADSSASTSSRPTCFTEHEEDSTDTGSSESVVPVHNLSPEREETQESTGIGTTNNRAKSDVWLYFSKGPTTTSALCTLCKREYAYRSGTSNLRNHLVCSHSDKFKPHSVQNIPDVHSLV